MRNFEDLTIEEIMLLDDEILKAEEINSLWLNPNVKEINDMGNSGINVGYEWVDVQLMNDDSIDVYYKR